MKKIGIVVAMQEEKEAMLNILTDVKVEQVYNLKFYKGKIKANECILVESGIGKVNAARTTQIIIDKYKVEYIINGGSGGSINELLNIGDVIISKHIIQHDFDITAFGHSKGYITGVGDKITCDINLVENFKKLIESFEDRSYETKIGIIATGDIFCTDVSMKDKIRAKFKADVVDMESAAIAQVCYLNNVPFIAIRCISDTPNGKNYSTFEENLKLASKRSANILKKYLYNF